MTPPNLTATVSYDTPKSNNSYCNNDIPKSYQRCRDPVSVLSWPRHQSIQIKRAEISSTTNRPLQSWRPVQKKKSFRNKSEPSLCFLKRNNIHVHLFIKGSCLYKIKASQNTYGLFWCVHLSPPDAADKGQDQTAERPSAGHIYIRTAKGCQQPSRKKQHGAKEN